METNNQSNGNGHLPGGTGRLQDHPDRLLLADDEFLIAKNLARVLEDLGYTVIGPASSGEEAVELCREHQPHLALLDIRMNPMDGLDAAKIVFDAMQIPVIIFSAHSDETYIESGSRIGVFNYLLKPITREQLHAAITVSWSRYRAWAEQELQISKLWMRLEERKTIEQAKWLMVQHRGVSEPEAMRWLQTRARNTRKPLVDVARGVIATYSLEDAEPSDTAEQ